MRRLGVMVLAAALSLAWAGAAGADILAALHRQAEQGDAQAQFELGFRYASGQGVDQDYGRAVKWLNRAAEQGETRAQVFLGLMHTEGRGVARDYVVAHMWFSLAAASGDKNVLTALSHVEKKMTPSQIAEAKKRAEEWTAKHGQK